MKKTQAGSLRSDKEMKILKQLANGVGIANLSDRGGNALVDLRAAIPTQTVSEEAKKVLESASLWSIGSKNQVQDNVPVAGAPVITDERYVYAKFRALSQTHLVNRGLDFSTPGVLEKAVTLLGGRTVYPNHDFTDIYNWLGVVSNASWDAEGAASDGIPGINAEIKIDAFLNYRIACGLMMSPPAVNAMSLTVVFEFEYSHPQLAMESRWKFFDMLGEEVDGEIVRMIVTNIVEFWEASLVHVGEDRTAKQIEAARGGTQSFSAEKAEEAAEIPPPNSNEEKTMNIPKETRTKLGIGFDGDDVPETEIFKAAENLAARVEEMEQSATSEAIAELKTQAEAGKLLLDEKRTEVTRLAKVAELGADDKDLDPVLETVIKEADAKRLTELGAYYGKKVNEKFPQGGRSSLENSDEVDTAGGTGKAQTAEVPKSSLL